MTGKEFMINLQGYYGASYNHYQGPIVRRWVEDYKGDLAEILKYLVDSCEFLPKVSMLEKAAAFVRKEPAFDPNALPPPPQRFSELITDHERRIVQDGLKTLIGNLAKNSMVMERVGV